MPNALALAALALWPVMSVILFRRLPAGRALLASLLIAYLFLPPAPAGFDLPLMPPLTKETIPNLVAAIVCLVMYRPGLRFLPDSRLMRALLGLYMLSPVLTVLTNGEPVFYGAVGLPGLSAPMAVGMMINQALMIAPMLLAMNLLRSAADLRDALAALVIAGLVYSLPMLLEVRLAPQLNLWVYGFFQHNFEQMVRFGGYRPLVFLYHGLWVAFFAMTAVVAAAALWRTSHGPRWAQLAIVTVYLAVVLVLCKSVASILYAMALLPLVLLAGPRWQLRVAVVLAVLSMAYPLAKGAHIVPEDQMLTMAASIDPDRAASLQFRFDQERILLERAEQKPLFGWGIWGRNHILDPNDGHILTVTDGRWIIVIGVLGWLGFLAEFGLLTAPVLLLWWRSRGQDLSPHAAALSLIVAINMVDLIPNATITPLTWLFAGAVLGHAETLVRRARRPAAAPVFRTVL